MHLEYEQFMATKPTLEEFELQLKRFMDLEQVCMAGPNQRLWKELLFAPAWCVLHVPASYCNSDWMCIELVE